MGNQLTEIKKSAKSFWDTSEGTTGMIFGAGILGFLGYGAYKIMPYIANLLENTFYAILFGLLSIGLIWAFVIDGTLRNRLWVGYKLVMRALTYSIISYDPIGVLREVQKKAKERIGIVDDNRKKVNGQKTQIAEAINSIKDDMDDLKKRVEIRKKNDQMAEAQNDLAKLGRLNESAKRLQVSLTRTEGFCIQLTRAQKALETIDENIDFEITVTEREYKATTAANTAWRAVRDAFKGGTELDQLGQETWAFLAEDYGNKLGEIDSFMEDSAKFIDNVDLSNAMFAEDGLKVLEELNSRDLSNIVKPATAAIKQVTNDSSFVNINSTVKPKTVDYATLRTNKSGEQK